MQVTSILKFYFVRKVKKKKILLIFYSNIF